MNRRGTYALLAALIVIVLGVTTGCAGGDRELRGGVVTLEFQSLAYQKPTIAAVKNIVASWNRTHPRIQIVYRQGSWDSVHDQLVTQFTGGTEPTIIHDDAADIEGFAQMGFLADIGPHLSPDVRRAVPPSIMNTVAADGRTYGAPTLLQSYVVFANTDLLKRAGITPPANGTVSWDMLRAMAKRATGDGVHGLGWGLKEPTAAVLSLAQNFDGGFFTGSGHEAQVAVGANEKQVPRRIHEMAYLDKSIEPTTLTQGGSDILPGFYAGRYAMIVAGSFLAQQIADEAPPGFRWQVLPSLAGTSARQAANPQVLSVSATSKHVREATAFINYFMSAKNLATLGRSDHLIPTTADGRAAITRATGGADGWGPILAGATNLGAAPFQSAANYPRWKDQIATPALQRYLGNKISLDQLGTQLSDGWNDVNQ